MCEPKPLQTIKNLRMKPVGRIPPLRLIPLIDDTALKIVCPHLCDLTVAGILTVSGPVAGSVQKERLEHIGDQGVPVVTPDILEMGSVGQFVGRYRIQGGIVMADVLGSDGDVGRDDPDESLVEVKIIRDEFDLSEHGAMVHHEGTGRLE